MPGKISELAALATPAADDLIEVLDVSDTTMALSGTNKKSPVSSLGAGGGDGAQFPYWSSVYGANKGLRPLNPFYMVGSNANQAQIVAGRIWYWPILFPHQATLASIQLEVTVTGAASQFRVGLYPMGVDGQPSGAPLVASGNLSAATAGVKTYATSAVLPAGGYLFAITTDVSFYIRADAGGFPWPEFMSNVFGGGSAVILAHRYVTAAYAALPTPGTAWNTAVHDIVNPLVGFEIASWT